jgi:hypothetical protein
LFAKDASVSALNKGGGSGTDIGAGSGRREANVSGTGKGGNCCGSAADGFSHRATESEADSEEGSGVLNKSVASETSSARTVDTPDPFPIPGLTMRVPYAYINSQTCASTERMTQFVKGLDCPQRVQDMITNATAIPAKTIPKPIARNRLVFHAMAR